MISALIVALRGLRLISTSSLGLTFIVIIRLAGYFHNVLLNLFLQGLILCLIINSFGHFLGLSICCRNFLVLIKNILSDCIRILGRRVLSGKSFRRLKYGSFHA